MVDRQSINTKHFIMLVLLTFLSVTFLANSLRAQEAESDLNISDVSTRYVKPFPEIPVMPDAEFEELTKDVNFVPYGDMSLAYEMRLPKDWDTENQRVESSFSMDSKLFTELNNFIGPADVEGRSSVVVRGIDLDFDLTAKQWFLKYLLESGNLTEAMVVHSDTRVEALMVKMDGDQTFAVRTVVVINGGKVIYLEYSIPASSFSDGASLQARVVQSFKLQRIMPQKEFPTDIFSFLDIGEFKYPTGWVVVSRAFKNLDFMNAKVLNVTSDDEEAKKTPNGAIDISLVMNSSAQNVFNQINDYKKMLQSSGILLGDKITNIEDLQYDSRAKLALTEVYKGINSNSEKSNYELWFTILSVGNYYVFITLLTPSRGENYIAWAYNTQGYRRLVTSFKPQTGAFIERAE